MRGFSKRVVCLTAMACSTLFLWAVMPAADFFVLLLFLAADLAIFAALWALLGREPKTAVDSDYEREPPGEYGPAVVQMLVNPNIEAFPSMTQVIGEILHLCLLKKIDITERGGKITGIAVKNSDLLGLPKSKRLIMKEIIAAEDFRHRKFEAGLLAEKPEKGKISFEELVDYLEATPKKTRKLLEKWQLETAKEFRELGFFSNAKGGAAFICLSCGLALSSILGNGIIWVALAAEAAALLLAFPMALMNRTPKGAEHYEKWMRFKRFLQDFGAIEKHPAEGVKIWGEYMVYAFPLGIAEKAEKTKNPFSSYVYYYGGKYKKLKI